MTQQPERQGAEIIPFPTRRADAKSAARETATRERLPVGVSVCEFGSGWYHDEAMQEEARRRTPR